MNQVTVSVPLDEFPDDILPKELLKIAPEIRFLRTDLDGFVFVCHVPKKEVSALVGIIRKNYKRIRIEHDGSEKDEMAVIRVSGGWWGNARGPNDSRQAQAVGMLRTLMQAQIYMLSSPEIRDRHFRFSLVGDSGAIKRLHEIFGKIGMRYSVAEVSKTEAVSGSPFDRLTAQQMRILRLAYSLGYYDVPRKLTTEQLARMLKMNKGTVGEHLRRAEKHVFDRLFV